MGKCSFKPSWLSKTDSLGYKISSWAQKKDHSNVWCTVCESSIKVSKGFQALSQHSEKNRHKESIEMKYGPKQLHLTALPGSSKESSNSDYTESTPKSISLCSSTYNSDRAELIWTMKCVASNFSGNSCKGIDRVFRAMFAEDSSNTFPNDFSLGPTKFSYLVTEALGPYFKERMLQDAYKSYYSILYDETTNGEGKKELQIGIKYFSEKHNEVITSHLTSIFMGSAKAEEISSNIIKSLDNLSLSLNKLIMIGSDGPPVNAKVFRLINEEVRSMPQRTNGLLQIGTCNLHIINNTFLKGLEIYGHEISELIIGVYYFFHGWPLRIEEFESAQTKKKVPHHKFIKHSSIRWLTLEGAALRILEQWPALIYYFLDYIPSKKSQQTANSYKRIANLLQTKTMKAQLLFVIYTVQTYSKFSSMFQKEEPLIHALYDEMKDLLLTIMKRICKKKVVDDIITNENFENVFEEENLLFSKDIVIGDTIVVELQKLPESYQKDFLHNARKHYIESGKYLIRKVFQSSNCNLKYFKFLQSEKISDEESCQNIVKIAKSLPGSINISMLIDEWHLLQTEKLSVHVGRIDHFWRNIFEIKNALGHTKYPILQKVIKICLSVSHGSADIERGFSLSGRIISEDRTNMSERTLNAKLHIMDALKHFNYEVELVPITSELLLLAKNANKKYKEHLEEERKQKELQKKLDDDEERILQEKEIEMKKLKENLKSIKQLENNLIKVQDAENTKTKATTKLLTEANERLKEGIKNQDFTEIQLAQAMIEGAKTIKAQEDEQRAKALKIEKRLQKRKSSVITNVFQKKSKTDLI